VIGDFAAQRMDFGVINVAEDADVAGVSRQVERLLVATPDIVVSDRSAFTAQLTRQIDQVLTYFRVLLGGSILIVVLGIVKIGLLRAIGFRTGQVYGWSAPRRSLSPRWVP
jgi:hypothetical protein